MREYYLRLQKPRPKRISRDLSDRIQRVSRSIRRRSSLVWSEHCTECAMPDCFITCEYYTPRPDMKCQRFADGISQIVTDRGRPVSAFGVVFKRWGKLEAEGRIALQRPGLVRLSHRLLPAFERVVYYFPGGYQLKVLLSRFANKLLKILSGRGVWLSVGCGAKFYIETFNPGTVHVNARLTLRDKNDPSRYFQKLLRIPQKYNLQAISLEELSQIDLKRELLFQFEPELGSSNVELYFGLLDFAILGQRGAEPSVRQVKKEIRKVVPAKVKCVVWDLDNTLWNGTLIEDGPDGIRIREEARDCIISLDQRGILNSIASKNNSKDALAALEKLGLLDYFLYPQINWGPKSVSVEKIQKSLNIGMDSIVFIDDQPFEREEVESIHSEIRVLSDTAVATLLERVEFATPVTDESGKRRQFYQDQIQRDAELVSTSNDYESFLRSCRLEVEVEPLSPGNLPRVHELAQRTNQMNFSGSRYSRDDLELLRVDKGLQTCVMSSRDKFGEYGIIGFAIIRQKEAVLEDLMFSCRVQAKRIEHAFLLELIAMYQRNGANRFIALYSPTDRNRQAAQVFPELKFIQTGVQGGRVEYSMDLDGDIPKQDIVAVNFQREATVVGPES